MRMAFAPYRLKFISPAGTSRGILTEKPTYFIKIYDERMPEIYGIGEAALFPGLSPEANDRYEYKLIETLANVALGRGTDLSHHSSILFGLEQAIQDFSSGGRGLYYPGKFTRGESSVTINGLVWMGNYDEMLQRLEEKISAGFKCIKIKIGAIEWSRERELLRLIRNRFNSDSIEVRVDANGGFNMDNVFPVLGTLADLGIHSIEQPIPAGNYELMSFICNVSPVPVALDEELIGISGMETKQRLLAQIKPAYIILKPALCGGFSGASEWIKAAEEANIGWWVTSALESNVGLNAISQWCASLDVEMPQGLGTGALYENNFPSPLILKGDKMWYDKDVVIDRSVFDSLQWRE